MRFLESLNPAVIDRGVRKAIVDMQLSVLSISLGLYKIKNEKLFKDLGFKNITLYVENVSQENKIGRSTLFNWLKIGETYNKYREELEEIGFSDLDAPTKLPYLERALKKCAKDQVLFNLMNMSLREFSDFAKTSQEIPASEAPLWEEKGFVFEYQGKRAIIINSELGETVINMMKATTRLGFRALARNGHVIAVHLDNADEFRRFRKIARRARRKMREKINSSYN